MKDYSRIFTKGRKVWANTISNKVKEFTVLSIEEDSACLQDSKGTPCQFLFIDISTSPFTIEIKGFEQKELLPEIAQKTPVWVKYSTCWDIVLFHSFSESGMLVCGIYDQHGIFFENDRFSEWSLTDPFETK